MSIGAAVSITSPSAGRIIAAASLRAQERGEQCFVISVVRSTAEELTKEELEVVANNLSLITSRNASPVVQEADDVPRALISAADIFGIRTLFIGSARRRRFGRSVAERLVRLGPPFEIVVVTRDE
jgi:K+-sensing histidine kinase KdpD